MTTRTRTLGATIALAALAAATTLGPWVRAQELPPPRIDWPEANFDRPWIEVSFPARLAPKRARLVLVESGAPAGQAQRVRVAPRRAGDDQSVTGRVPVRLVADRVYDVEVRSAKGEPLFLLPSAFVARAPRSLRLRQTVAAHGETVTTWMEFGPRRARFTIGGVAARVVLAMDEEFFDETQSPARVLRGTSFTLEVPRRLPRDVEAARVVASMQGARLEAQTQLGILTERREMSGVVDGELRKCREQHYMARPNELIIEGQRLAGRPGGGNAYTGFNIHLPVDLSTLTLPVTFTQADGGYVEWVNVTDAGRFLPGPRGSFASATFTVTLESLRGTRLQGTFSAHCRDAYRPGHEPDGTEVEVTEGRFRVDPMPTGR